MISMTTTTNTHPDFERLNHIIKSALALSDRFSKDSTGLPPLRPQDLENIVRYTLSDRLNAELQARFKDLTTEELKLALAILTDGKGAAPGLRVGTNIAGVQDAGQDAPPASIVPGYTGGGAKKSKKHAK